MNILYTKIENSRTHFVKLKNLFININLEVERVEFLTSYTFFLFK